MNKSVPPEKINMTMQSAITKQLQALAEEDYRQFSAKLLPNIDNVLGVRLPKLRAIAKRISTHNWRAYLESAQSQYFEELMLQGMVIGYAQAEDIDTQLAYVAAFVPKIDNWSVCDSFCTGLKFTNRHKTKVWDFLTPYFSSKNEFEIRFAVVMLLFYYIEEERIDAVLAILDQIAHDGYYVKMAVVWAISLCFVNLPVHTLPYLQKNTLDKWTHNKALQKIIESRCVDSETKTQIRSLKRKDPVT